MHNYGFCLDCEDFNTLGLSVRYLFQRSHTPLGYNLKYFCFSLLFNSRVLFTIQLYILSFYFQFLLSFIELYCQISIVISRAVGLRYLITSKNIEFTFRSAAFQLLDILHLLLCNVE